MGERVDAQNTDWLAWVGNSLSLTAIAGTLIGWLPPLAAFAAICWYSIQIYESKTFQSWLKRRRCRKVERLQRELARIKDKRGKGDDDSADPV